MKSPAVPRDQEILAFLNFYLFKGCSLNVLMTNFLFLFGNFAVTSLSADPSVKNTLWSLTFGLAFSWITFYGTSQTAVQRYSSLRTLTQARL